MKTLDYERYLRMAAAAEARGFLKTTFLLEGIDCGGVSANFKRVDFDEVPGLLKTVFRCCVSVSCRDGVERYIVCGIIGHAGISCHSIITDDGDTGVLIYWNGRHRECENHLQTVKQRRNERQKQAQT